jgi:hypothetical protein
MNTFNANFLFSEASGKLSKANEEICRPEEDVVSFMVCKNSQFAVESFLTGYLLQHDVTPDSHATIKSLYEKCLEINPKFSRVNLSDFDCRSHQTENRDCTDPNKVNKCLKVANDLEAFLKAENVLN